ncbi:Nuclease-related domain-containing protein [Quadrisphaera granulorum]|uniref:DNA 3'-5' helicase n=1 Tax=Quadrisphaera granulorum TaxID=317664 RepID=A0A315ZPB4_9ACTN|nr:UvrD-helicase domain-containing protein [Quadrisphaera granulorum]PWJ46860.1 nuclease-like protein [Quadrisphaera granulorum]SZE99027.1 Nuclease-related domain-containing protein [Quadrisphaera granulorum]
MSATPHAAAAGAGDSQARLAQHARAMVAEYERLLREEQDRAARHSAAATTERRVATRLSAMSAWGWHLLADRRWPGTRAANVDLIQVGPGGVLVIDVKGWAEPRIEAGVLWRGEVDATDDVDALLAVTAPVEDAVAGLGLAPLHVQPVVVLAGRRAADLPPTSLGRVLAMGEHRVVPWASQRARRLQPERVAEVAAELARTFPPHDVASNPVAPRTPRPVLARVPDLPADEQLELFDRATYEEGLLRAALAAPVEEWMTFLHPDQMRIVRRAMSGPARISGPAGTGKSVVALHRAAHLASTRPGRVLVTTYVKSLVRVQERLYRQLSPRTADRVEFSSIHSWAGRLLRERGHQLRVDPAASRQAFDEVWARHAQRPQLADVPVPPSYWREEVDAVIKGRGLTTFGEYALLKRVGRRVPLFLEHREAVWDLYVDYQHTLQARGLHDFVDLLCEALAEVRRSPVTPGYVAVIADEVQDLSMVGVQLLHALVGDAPDGLLLLGDSQQSVYPGGFTLLEAGISVKGRSTVLRTNYRNTAEVLAAAAQLAEADNDADTDATDEDPDEDDDDGVREPAGAAGRRVSVLRAGGAVVRSVHANRREHDAALVDAVRASAVVVPLGDCAVLTLTNAEAQQVRALLTAAGIPVADLADYDGEPSAALKVGTVKRAKGLEFKHVFLPHPVTRPPQQRRGEGDAAYEERRALTRHEVYVAMTRARDQLWMGSYRSRSGAAEPGGRSVTAGMALAGGGRNAGARR